MKDGNYLKIGMEISCQACPFKDRCDHYLSPLLFDTQYGEFEITKCKVLHTTTDKVTILKPTKKKVFWNADVPWDKPDEATGLEIKLQIVTYSRKG